MRHAVKGSRAAFFQMVVTLALVSSAVIGLSSCNARNETEDLPESTVASELQQAPINTEGASASEEAGKSDANEDDALKEASASSSNKKAPTVKSIADIGGIFAIRSDFSEGVAWVDAGSGKSTGLFQIDKDGTILYDSRKVVGKTAGVSNTGGFPIAYDNESGRYLYSTVPNGYHNETALVHVFYSDAKDKTTTAEQRGNAIVDKSGNIIWSTEKDGWKEGARLFGDDVVVAVRGQSLGSYHGYFFVEYDLDSYEYTGNAVGVIDSAGKWLVEPLKHGQRDISKYSNEIVTERNWSCGYTSKFMVSYLDGKVTYFDESDSDEDVDMDPADIADACDDASEKKLSDDGYELIEQLNPQGEKYYAICEDDGFTLAELENDGGGHFLAVEDSSGKMLFNPIRWANHGELAEGAFFYDDHYLSADGKELGEIIADEGRNFHEGRAWFRSESEFHCIDANGDVVF